jgi:hypothetical protein
MENYSVEQLAIAIFQREIQEISIKQGKPGLPLSETLYLDDIKVYLQNRISEMKK